MYQKLTLKNHLGSTIAIVESVDGCMRVIYTDSRNLRLALESHLMNGINAPRYVNNSIFRIISKPHESNFLEKLSEYYQLSYDYLPLITQSKDSIVQTRFLVEQTHSGDLVEPKLQFEGIWPSVSDESSNLPVSRNSIGISDDKMTNIQKYDDWSTAIGWG
jgi:hypothetical protein